MNTMISRLQKYNLFLNDNDFLFYEYICKNLICCIPPIFRENVMQRKKVCIRQSGITFKTFVSLQAKTANRKCSEMKKQIITGALDRD